MSAGGWLPGAPRPLADVHDLLLLDLDGTLYLGADVVPGAPAAVEAAAARGAHPVYVTNNASRPAAAIAEHLEELGFRAPVDDVVTSAQAAAAVLARELPAGAAVLVVGGDGLRTALRAQGLTPVASATEQPLAVAQGLAPDVDWTLLAEGTYAVLAGARWIATNTDRTLPTARGTAPGNGALVEVIRVATGREPLVVGKPERPLLDLALDRVPGRRPLLVGDRLDTDVACAVAAGLPSLLVLTGVTDLAGLLAAGPEERPTHVSAGLEGLLVAHPPVQEVRGGGWRCEGWAGEVDDAGRLSVLQVEGATDTPGAARHGSVAASGLAALRAACAASWQGRDDGRKVDVTAALPVLERLTTAG